jgi:cyclopropane-fatty-acyl-phospholipid synthase
MSRGRSVRIADSTGPTYTRSVRRTVSSHRLRTHFERIVAPADIRIDGDRPWDVRVHDERLYQRVLAHGTLGLGEAYMDGWWSCDAPDEMVMRAQRSDIPARLMSPTTMVRIAQAKVMNLQSKHRAFEVGERHYDIGNDLYERMLDRRMIYSCAYWSGEATGAARDLDAAQEAKLTLVASKLGLEPGMRVLDIGCGWGGAAYFFAERYGCELVGLTVSKEQAALARERCRELPVDIRLTDYRELDEPFDRVYSIGMFEHVGVKNYRTYMDVVRRCLRDGDSLTLLHTIGGNRSRGQTDPWVERYIFPNGMLPSIAQIARAAEGRLVMEDWHNFGPDYDTTLMAWKANIDARWHEIADRYDDRFKRMWDWYLWSSAGSFRARALQLWQVVLSRDGIAGGYHAPHIR